MGLAMVERMSLKLATKVLPNRKFLYVCGTHFLIPFGGDPLQEFLLVVSIEKDNRALLVLERV